MAFWITFVIVVILFIVYDELFGDFRYFVP